MIEAVPVVVSDRGSCFYQSQVSFARSLGGISLGRASGAVSD